MTLYKKTNLKPICLDIVILKVSNSNKSVRVTTSL